MNECKKDFRANETELNEKDLVNVDGGRKDIITCDINKENDLYNNRFDQTILNTNYDLDSKLKINNNAADDMILTDNYALNNKLLINNSGCISSNKLLIKTK